jgi:hypothetical protein
MHGAKVKIVQHCFWFLGYEKKKRDRQKERNKEGMNGCVQVTVS